jgi:hypothetical protein
MTKITAYKAFNEDWTCRGFQFEVGKTYEHEGDIEICRSGFHACLNPLDMLRYYPLIGSNFAEVEFEGDIEAHSADSKVCGAKITISAKVEFGDLIERAVAWIARSVKGGATSGYRGEEKTSGDDSPSATSGNSSPSATSGDSSHSATSGDDSPSATSGYRSPSEASGQNSVAAAIGRNSKARAGETGGIALAEYDADGKLVSMFASLVGQNGIKPNVWYELKGGKPVEVSS